MTVTERIVNNIHILARQKHMKMGDLERKLGVSPGYFAHVRKANSAIGIDKVYTTAELFGVSMDELVNVNMEKEEKKRKLQAEIARLQGMLEAEDDEQG